MGLVTGKRWCLVACLLALPLSCKGEPVAGDSSGTVGGACDGCDGSWGNELALSDGNLGTSLGIAMNEAGAAVVAWSSGDDEILASLYIPGQGWSGWSERELVVEDAFPRAVGIDEEGNALVLSSAISTDELPEVLWTTRHLVGFGWESAEPVNTNPGVWESHTSETLAMTADGSARAVWVAYDGSGHYSIQSNRYVPGKGWGSSTPILVADQEPLELRLAAAPSGDAVVLWREQVGERGLEEHTIWSSRVAAGSEWAPPESLSSIVGFSDPYDIDYDDSGTYWLYSTDSYPNVAVDARGNAIAVWSQYNDDRWQVWVNRLDASTGWEGAQLLSDTPNDALYPEIGVDAEGNAVAIWTEADGCQVRQYGLESGWGDAKVLPGACGGLAVGSAGHAVVLSSNGTQATRYTPDIGWGAPEITQLDDDFDNWMAEVAVDGDGNAIIVWRTNTILASISPAPQ